MYPFSTGKTQNSNFRFISSYLCAPKKAVWTLRALGPLSVKERAYTPWKQLLRHLESVASMNEQHETRFTNVGAVCPFVRYQSVLQSGKNVSDMWHLYKSTNQPLLMTRECSVFVIPKGLVSSGKDLSFQGSSQLTSVNEGSRMMGPNGRNVAVGWA